MKGNMRTTTEKSTCATTEGSARLRQIKSKTLATSTCRGNVAFQARKPLSFKERQSVLKVLGHIADSQ